ncbi:co-chaperone GroES [Vampirovibrio sp.]|uniref:co-chaperone GroES n=1 Tax=Vampirovibrio sp. TaxID=2717857 RepID=UPI0035934F53
MPTTETKIAIKPLGDRVVLEVLEETEQSSGGIYLPETAREKPQKGKILAVGPGKLNDSGKRDEMQVQVGNVVLFAKYSGTDVKLENKEVKIMSEKDILGIIEG